MKRSFTGSVEGSSDPLRVVLLPRLSAFIGATGEVSPSYGDGGGMDPVARRRLAPRDAVTVAVEICASAENRLLNDVVAIPVLAVVRHCHRRIAAMIAAAPSQLRWRLMTSLFCR